MRITEGQLRRLIRETLLREAYEDIRDIAVRLRVKVDEPEDPSVLDILTTVRGIPKVITVTQHGPMGPAPEGKNMLDIIVSFEDDETYDLPDLERDLKGVGGVDMVRILGSQERDDDT